MRMRKQQIYITSRIVGGYKAQAETNAKVKLTHSLRQHVSQTGYQNKIPPQSFDQINALR